MLRVLQLCSESLKEEVNRLCLHTEVENCTKDEKGIYCFVSLSERDNLLGYFFCQVNWETHSVYVAEVHDFGKRSREFLKDVYSVIYMYFTVYGFSRFEWRVCVDDPSADSYKEFVFAKGGRECGHLRQDILWTDGKLHDSIILEMLKEDFSIAAATQKDGETEGKQAVTESISVQNNVNLAKSVMKNTITDKPESDNKDNTESESGNKDDEKIHVFETKAPERRKIDHRKIRALKNAGWSNKKIAEEMHMKPNAVALSLYQHKELIEELQNV